MTYKSDKYHVERYHNRYNNEYDRHYKPNYQYHYDRYYNQREYDQYYQAKAMSSKKKSSAKDEGPMKVLVRRAVLLVGLITMILNAFIVGAPYWRTTLMWYGVSRVTGIWSFEGLFLTCVKQGYQGLSQCYNLYPIMGAVDGEVGVRSGKDHNIYRE